MGVPRLSFCTSLIFAQVANYIHSTASPVLQDKYWREGVERGQRDHAFSVFNDPFPKASHTPLGAAYGPAGELRLHQHDLERLPGPHLAGAEPHHEHGCRQAGTSELQSIDSIYSYYMLLYVAIHIVC